MTVPTSLVIQDLSVGYGPTAVVDGITASIPPGAVSTFIGPNGSGKSTLVRAVAGLMKPQGGHVLLDGHDLHAQSPRDVARRIAFLPQNLVAPEHVTVRQLVSHGRDPHRRWFDAWSTRDTAAVERALAVTDTTELAEHPVDELSGGQRQRAWIALTLAQEPRVLILDEPTTYLDVAHQLDTLQLVTDLVRDHGVTVVMVLHDLTMAARFSDTLLAMHNGRLAVAGTPREVLTEDTLARVFGIRADIEYAPDRGLRVVPTARVAGAAG